MPELEIRHNQPAHRFEAGSEPGMARLDYRITGAAVNMYHTEVPPASQGAGLGGRLAAAALDWASGAGLKVIPGCPFIADYIRKHPEYKSLL